jgi:gamma-glutamylcyclotransferase (GGCT)/AIG2-like uncharacterized protein YtfP
MYRLFVYGSLKRGCSNAGMLRGAIFERAGATAPGHALHDAGPYPVLARYGSGVVHGEIYRVTAEQLAELDRFEGCPDEYQREEVVLDDGSTAAAYVVSPARARLFPAVPGGRWEDPTGSKAPP